jgi:hypothetical protein
MVKTREHAHELVERLAPPQMAALVHFLEAMLDPVSRAIANAPVDDEAETAEERQAVAEAKEWLTHHPGIPFEEILSDFDLTIDDLRNEDSR